MKGVHKKDGGEKSRQTWRKTVREKERKEEGEKGMHGRWIERLRKGERQTWRKRERERWRRKGKHRERKNDQEKNRPLDGRRKTDGEKGRRRGKKTERPYKRSDGARSWRKKDRDRRRERWHELCRINQTLTRNSH